MSDFVQFPEEKYDPNAFKGFTATGQFDLRTALAMMWFAQLAYEVDNTGGNATTGKIERIKDKWGFRSVRPFRKQAIAFGGTFDTTGIVGEREGAIVLAFAGTDPAAWETVATDFDLAIDNATHVHKGFQAALEAVKEPVDDAIGRSDPVSRPLFIAGHSLGAALGFLTALRAANGHRPPRAVYGYGTPRVGSADFQAEYNARLGDVTYRLVHGSDLVARVPMSFLGYRHVGRVLQCDSNARFQASDLSPNHPGQPRQPDQPDFTPQTFLGLLSVINPLEAARLTAQILSPPMKTQEELRDALLRLLQPPGHGPLGSAFRLIPPVIREHLQDRYIAALTPP